MPSRLSRLLAFLLLVHAFAPAHAGDRVPSGDVARPPSPGSLRIVGARLLTPPYRVASAPADVLVAEGRIVAIGRDAGIAAVEREIDARGAYLMPGLVDAHVHVSHVAGFADADYERHADLLPAYFAQLPRSYLRYGFTTLVDPDLAERTARRWAAAPLKPRLLGCGRGIRWPNSYGPGLFPAEDAYAMFPNWVYDPAQADRIPPRFAPADYTAEAAVRRALAGGAICIKTYYQPAWPSRAPWPLPSRDQLAEIVAAAHAAGRPLWLHATSLEAYRVGLDAGADLFAHGIWKRESPFGPVPLVEGRALMRELAAAGKAVMPTRRVLLGERDGGAAVAADPRLAQVLPAAFLAWATGPDGSLARRALPDPEVDASLRTMIERSGVLLQAFADAGGWVVFGSDTPADEGLGNPPGLNGRLELDAMAQAGLTRARILLSATLDAARAIGLEHEIGSIEPGKRADLLLLDADPLREGMAAFDGIRRVIVDGVPVTVAELAADSDAASPDASSRRAAEAGPDVSRRVAPPSSPSPAGPAR